MSANMRFETISVRIKDKEYKLEVPDKLYPQNANMKDVIEATLIYNLSIALEENRELSKKLILIESRLNDLEWASGVKKHPF